MRERIGKWLAYHEAGHAVARLALDRELPYPGPMVYRVSITQHMDHRIISSRGFDTGAIGIAEMGARVWLSELPELIADARYWQQHEESVKRKARLDIIESYAGPAAEGISRRYSKGWIHLAFRTSDDFTRPVEVAKLLPMGNLDDLYNEAWRLMRRHWPSVKAVADALWIAKELDCEEVTRLAKL